MACRAELKRPQAPPAAELKRPAPPPPQPEQQSSSPAAPTSPSSSAAATMQEVVPQAPSGPSKSGLTVEYQREQARRMNRWFQSNMLQKKVEDTTVFGWTPKNEINNGRWVMFGWMVGFLTEYATGVDFPQQLLLMASYLGLADFD